VIGLAFVWGMCVPEPAGAEDRIPELTGEAAELYKRGRRQYREQNYDEAAQTLREAYRQFDHPLLLYNIALAEWRAGSYEQALRTARRADYAGIPPAFRPKVSGLTGGLRVRTRAEDLVSRSGDARNEREYGTGQERSLTRSGLSTMGWTGVTLGSLGFGAVAGAVWMDRRVANLESDFRRARRSSDPERYRALQDRIVREQWIGRTLLGVGTALGVVGGYLIVRDVSSPPRSDRTRDSNTSEDSTTSRYPSIQVWPGLREVGIRSRWF
jgi:tetratricopeptide (TPR) repeat protein